MRFKIGRPHENVAAGQHPQGGNPVGVREGKFQDKWMVGAKGAACSVCLGNSKGICEAGAGQGGNGGGESRKGHGVGQRS